MAIFKRHKFRKNWFLHFKDHCQSTMVFEFNFSFGNLNSTCVSSENIGKILPKSGLMMTENVEVLV